jgi:hypothetical protein
MFYVKLSESTATRKRVPVYLVDATDGFTPEIGVTSPTVEISKNGGSQAAGTGTFAEIGDGMYYYEFASGEIDTLGWVNVRIIKSGTSREYQTIAQISAYDAYNNTLGIFNIDNVVDGSYSLSQALNIMLAAMAGKSSKTGTTRVYRNTGDTKTRISATVNASGDRTSVTLDET